MPRCPTEARCRASRFPSGAGSCPQAALAADGERGEAGSGRQSGAAGFAVAALRCLAVAVLATGLAACTVGPDYARPAAPVPGEYREADGWQRAQPADARLRGDWWTIYGDPQLDALVREAEVSNQNLALAEASLRQAQALAREAGAALYPVAGVGAGVTRARSSAAGATGTAGGRTTSQYSLPLELSWEIDLWGRLRRGAEAGQATAEASAADLEAARLSVRAELVTNWLALRTLDARRRLLADTVEAYARALAMTRNRHAAGVASGAEVAQAETQLESTRAQALDLDASRATLEHAIAVLAGRPPATLRIAVREGPLPPVPALPAGLPSTLLERRPDIAAAERRVAAANAGIGVAEAAYYPSLNFSASAGFEAASLAKWISAPARVWALGPQLALTLFDGGARAAQVEAAGASWQGTVASYRQTVLTGFQEVEDALATLRILAAEAAVQDRAVTAARRSLELTMNQYRAGILAYLGVVVVQAQALAAESSAIDLQGRRLAASVALIRALGGGWQAGDPSPALTRADTR